MNIQYTEHIMWGPHYACTRNCVHVNFVCDYFTGIFGWQILVENTIYLFVWHYEEIKYMNIRRQKASF